MKINSIKPVTIAAILIGMVVVILYAQNMRAKALRCAQTLCEADQLPKYDTLEYSPFKIDNRIFLAPRKYGGTNGALGFYWPSRAPMQKSQLASEFKPSSAEHINNFYDVAVEIFIRSAKENIPIEPRGYSFIELAVANGWVEQKINIRQGLVEYRMKHLMHGISYLDHVDYFVATDLHGTDNMPPVATCAYARPDDRGGSGFLWHGVWVGINMSQKHCMDWPEIYKETMQVINQIKEVQ